MTSERSDSEAGRSTDTAVPKGTLPGTAGATVIVTFGQLFDDESWRRAFAVGGPALAAVGSAVWRWLAERLAPWFDLQIAIGFIDGKLRNPDISDEDKKKLEAERQRLYEAYLGRIRGRIVGNKGKNER